MRVLHVVAAYPTQERPHSQVFVKTQVDSLVDAGVDCAVLCLQGRRALKYLAGWSQVRRELKRTRYDLIHAHYAYCGLVCLGHGLPLVISLLGSDLVGRPRADGSYSRLSIASHCALSRFVVKRSASCIVKSHQMRVVLGLEAHILPNGVDLDRFCPLTPAERMDARTELGLDPRTRYILFAGDPKVSRKRFGLAQAAVQIAAASLPFALELKPLWGRSHDDVVKHMQVCDLLLLTSSWEGSPNVVKEAMASGLRVVSVDVGDTRERLAGVTGCRVTADDSPDSIGVAISEVLTSDEPCGSRAAVEPLRIAKVAAQVVAIYNRVLGSV